MAYYQFTADPFITPVPRDLPPNSYICTITKTDMLPTREGNGRYILIIFKVESGEYKGRKIFQNFNIENKNEQAVEISKRNLSQLCNALGIESFSDTDDLLNKEVIVKIGLNNKLFGFKKLEENQINNVEDDFKDDKIPF